MTPATALRAVKIVHTIVWAFMVAVIFAIPIAGWRRNVGWAAVLTAIVLIETAVLAINRRRCPLTDLAARYTDDRRDNFDIYLPLWLATYNKQIFGTLFLAGLLFTVVRVMLP